jgi:hypothetical protein
MGSRKGPAKKRFTRAWKAFLSKHGGEMPERGERGSMDNLARGQASIRLYRQFIMTTAGRRAYRAMMAEKYSERL